MALYFVILGTGGISRNTQYPTRNKDIVITAEIINGPELYKNIQYSKQKVKSNGTGQMKKVFATNKKENENSLTSPPIILSKPDIKDTYRVKSYLETDNVMESFEVIKGMTIVSNPIVKISVKDSLRIIRDSIEKAKVYPLLARKKGMEGKVIIRFRITPDGMVDDVKIVRSSGFEILDKVSIETIKRSAPLPYIDSRIEISLIFRLD
jgi:TonB family protein